MPTQKVQVPFTGPDGQTVQVDAVPVQIEDSTERWNEYTLEDGSRVRLKQVISEFYRVEGRQDVEGNPIYVLRGSPVMVVKKKD
jgi:hypothetical protein